MTTNQSALALEALNSEIIEQAAVMLAACMDYPWEHMPENGRETMREHAQRIISPAIALLSLPAEPVQEHTARGFALVNFNDRYNVPCSIQKSSLATEDAIWLGCDDANPRQLVPGKGWVPIEMPADYAADTRMHMTREQVESLLPILRHFVETGEVSAPPSPLPAHVAQVWDEQKRSYYAVIDEAGEMIHGATWPEACHEHINDAINEFQIPEAAKWKVIQLYAAQEQAERQYLNELDFAQLFRFNEICEDSDADGHDIPKEDVKRLCELGALRSIGFGRHEITSFGTYVIEYSFLQNPKLPLKTTAERNAAIPIPQFLRKHQD